MLHLPLLLDVFLLQGLSLLLMLLLQRLCLLLVLLLQLLPFRFVRSLLRRFLMFLFLSLLKLLTLLVLLRPKLLVVLLVFLIEVWVPGIGRSRSLPRWKFAGMDCRSGFGTIVRLGRGRAVIARCGTRWLGTSCLLWTRRTACVRTAVWL